MCGRHIYRKRTITLIFHRRRAAADHPDSVIRTGRDISRRGIATRYCPLYGISPAADKIMSDGLLERRIAIPHQIHTDLRRAGDAPGDRVSVAFSPALPAVGAQDLNSR